MRILYYFINTKNEFKIKIVPLHSICFILGSGWQKGELCLKAVKIIAMVS